MVQEPITITINITQIALIIYGISKIALAIYLQRCYLKATSIWVEKYGEIMAPHKTDMWGNFVTNLLLALEVTILKTIVYPLKLLITGSKETFLETVLPDEYKDSRNAAIQFSVFNPAFSSEKCNCSSNIDGRLYCPEHETILNYALSTDDGRTAIAHAMTEPYRKSMRVKCKRCHSMCDELDQKIHPGLCCECSEHIW